MQTDDGNYISPHTVAIKSKQNQKKNQSINQSHKSFISFNLFFLSCLPRPPLHPSTTSSMKEKRATTLLKFSFLFFIFRGKIAGHVIGGKIRRDQELVHDHRLPIRIRV
jgi:hypothetical protein